MQRISAGVQGSEGSLSFSHRLALKTRVLAWSELEGWLSPSCHLPLCPTYNSSMNTFTFPLEGPEYSTQSMRLCRSCLCCSPLISFLHSPHFSNVVFALVFGFCLGKQPCSLFTWSYFITRSKNLPWETFLVPGMGHDPGMSAPPQYLCSESHLSSHWVPMLCPPPAQCGTNPAQDGPRSPSSELLQRAGFHPQGDIGGQSLQKGHSQVTLNDGSKSKLLTWNFQMLSGSQPRPLPTTTG